MRYPDSFWLHLLLCLTLVMMVGLAPVVAQDSTNLLQNGGFEGNYVAIGGDPSLQVAPSWQPWSVPPPQGSDSSAINLRPDYQPAPANRIRSGSAAQEYNTFFATHDGGVFQRVPVSQGAELTFSVFVYVWSSATFANPDESAQPQDVDVQIGIDPLGGQDGTASSIIWSDAARFYDEYRQLSVGATAQATAVTVFIRSTPKGAIGVNNIYVDDASLVQTGSGSLPEPTQEVGDPTQEVSEPTEEATAPTEAPSQTSTPITAQPTSATVTTTTAPPVSPTAIPDVVAQFPNRLTHTVTAGDTVTALAARYNSTAAAITAANGLNTSGLILVGQNLVIPVPTGQGTPASTATATITTVPTLAGATATIAPTAAPTTASTHTVQAGETLFSLAQRYNTTVEALATLNNITNPNRITIGTVLRVPTGGSTPSTGGNTGGQFINHTVQPGENAFRIGLRYNITVERLAQANRLTNPNLVYVGQVLLIPR